MNCSIYRIHAISRSLTPKIPSTTTTSSASSSSQSTTAGASESSTPTLVHTHTFPNPGLTPTGLEVLETEKFRLTCYQTLTGTKFILLTDPLMANVDSVMKKVYELYADYVMKNPFYQLEMPVRCEGFDRHLAGWLRRN